MTMLLPRLFESWRMALMRLLRKLKASSRLQTTGILPDRVSRTYGACVFALTRMHAVVMIDRDMFRWQYAFVLVAVVGRAYCRRLSIAWPLPAAATTHMVNSVQLPHTPVVLRCLQLASENVHRIRRHVSCVYNWGGLIDAG